MKIRFSVVEEFLAELEAEQEHVEDRLVRLTYQYEQSTHVPFVYHLSVVAGFVVRGKLIYLQQVCGDIWQGEQIDKGEQARQRATEIAAQLDRKAAALTLCVRRGVFEF